MLKEDPDNRILKLLRNRDQQMAQRKEARKDISPITVLPTRTKPVKPQEPKFTTEEIIKHLDENYKPIKDCFTRFDNLFFDNLACNLTLIGQIIYINLYRLSHGWNKAYCTVGVKNLVEKTTMAKSTIRKAIKELEDKKYIKKIGWKQNGTTYQVLQPREILGVAGIPRNDTPEVTSIPRDGIPPLGIPRNDTPGKDSYHKDLAGIPRDSIPRGGIPRNDTPEKDSYHKDLAGIPRDGIPRDGIPRNDTPGDINYSMPDVSIPRNDTPENSGVINYGIPFLDTLEESLFDAVSSGVSRNGIPRNDPFKYMNINKNSLSKDMGNKKNKNTERDIKLIIEDFYNILKAGKVSTEKKKRGYNKIRELLRDGYSLSEISFAANWVAEGKAGEIPKSFDLVPHCIDEALKYNSENFHQKEKKSKTIEKLTRKEKKEVEEHEKIREREKLLDEYFEGLKIEQKEIIEKEATKELAETNPQFNNKNLSFMRDLLIKMKVREIVRKKYFTE